MHFNALKSFTGCNQFYLGENSGLVTPILFLVKTDHFGRVKAGK